MANTASHKTFGERLCTMLRVDFKRLLLSRTFYIIVAACLVAPILILVMTTMMDGTVSTNPQTGEETVIEGFDNVWQIIGSVSTPGADMGADAAAGAAASSTAGTMAGFSLFSLLIFLTP